MALANSMRVRHRGVQFPPATRLAPTVGGFLPDVDRYRHVPIGLDNHGIRTLCAT